MRRVLFLLALVAAMVFACAGVVLAQQGSQTPDNQDKATSDPAERSTGKAGERVPGKYIVLFKDDAVENPQQAANEKAQQYGLGLDHVYEHAVKGFSATIPEARLAAVREDPQVQKVEQVVLQEIVDDGMPTGVDRAEGDQNTKANSGSANTVSVDKAVAIIDTGLYKHADLDVKGGYNATSRKANNWSDGNGHGTHVAGTVGAKDNGSGVLGVAPGADLYAAKVCGSDGRCPTDAMIKGIDWVTGKKQSGEIDFAAANMSISTPDDKTACSSASDSLHLAICGLVNEGVAFALAAGNNTRLKNAYPEALTVSALADFDGTGGALKSSPTCGTDTTERDDTLANFSNYGPEVDIAAPGKCIRSTWNNGGYNTISGTSMATPHVAGAVALYLHARGQNPAQSGTEVDAIEAAIIGAAKPQGDACGYTNEHATSDSSKEPLLFVNSTGSDSSSFGGTGECNKLWSSTT